MPSLTTLGRYSRSLGLPCNNVPCNRINTTVWIRSRLITLRWKLCIGCVFLMGINIS